MPLFLESGFKLFAVFYDAVMHERDRLAAIIMRVGIDIIRDAVRRPTGMRDSRCTVQPGFFKTLVQFLYLPRHLQRPYPVPFQDSDARRIVSPVFKPRQPLY